MFSVPINCYLYLIFFITDLLDLDLSEGILRKNRLYRKYCITISKVLSANIKNSLEYCL